MIEKICPPALLYLGFSMIQITIDLFQGEYSTSLLKFIVMVIFTTILNLLCLNGFTKVVWFIVLIPILLLTYISSVLFYVFGINPGKTNINVQKQLNAAPTAAPTAAPDATSPARRPTAAPQQSTP
jgi:glucan phosphoethanolaminetransferase (alkaline phosphatase superfamily)